MTNLEHAANAITCAARTAVTAADKAVTNGRELIETAALMRKRDKAQQQLGALVYSLKKRNEENTLLIEKYIDTIDRIEGKLAKYSKTIQNTTSVCICSHCGQKAIKNAVFCRSCGERL